MRKTVTIDVFCYNQAHLFQIMDKYGIIKVTRYADGYDEISHNLLCQRLEVLIPSWFEGILYWLVMHSIDQEGQERIDRLIKRGLVTRE